MARINEPPMGQAEYIERAYCYPVGSGGQATAHIHIRGRVTVPDAYATLRDMIDLYLHQVAQDDARQAREGASNELD